MGHLHYYVCGWISAPRILFNLFFKMCCTAARSARGSAEPARGPGAARAERQAARGTVGGSMGRCPESGDGVPAGFGARRGGCPRGCCGQPRAARGSVSSLLGGAVPAGCGRCTDPSRRAVHRPDVFRRRGPAFRSGSSVTELLRSGDCEPAAIFSPEARGSAGHRVALLRVRSVLAWVWRGTRAELQSVLGLPAAAFSERGLAQGPVPSAGRAAFPRPSAGEGRAGRVHGLAQDKRRARHGRSRTHRRPHPGHSAAASIGPRHRLRTETQSLRQRAQAAGPAGGAAGTHPAIRVCGSALGRCPRRRWAANPETRLALGRSPPASPARGSLVAAAVGTACGLLSGRVSIRLLGPCSDLLASCTTV